MCPVLNTSYIDNDTSFITDDYVPVRERDFVRESIS